MVERMLLVLRVWLSIRTWQGFLLVPQGLCRWFLVPLLLQKRVPQADQTLVWALHLRYLWLLCPLA